MFLGDGFRAGDRIPLLQYTVNSQNSEGVPTFGPAATIFRNAGYDTIPVSLMTAGLIVNVITSEPHGFTLGDLVEMRGVFGFTPLTITSIVMSSGTLEVTTSAPHGLATDNLVQINAVISTFSTINKDWTITVTGASTFRLNGSNSVTGIYISGGTTGLSVNKVWTVTPIGFDTFALNGSATISGTYGSGGIAVPHSFKSVANARLSPVDFMDRKGLYGLLYQLDADVFIPAKYTVVYNSNVDGNTIIDMDQFEVRDGGNSDGAVLSMGYWTRPEGAYVLAQLADGKVGTGFQPAVIPG